MNIKKDTKTVDYIIYLIGKEALGPCDCQDGTICITCFCQTILGRSKLYTQSKYNSCEKFDYDKEMNYWEDFEGK